MEIIRTILAYCESKDLKFLISGGQAINAYGISRQTADLDFIVEKEKKSAWSELLKKIDYISFQDDDRFSRYKPSQIAAWPIDLMYVDSETFEKLYKESKEFKFGASTARAVSARHLVTLKVHALKHYQAHREPKDYGDVLALLKTGQAKFGDEELKGICLKYASLELYDRIKKDLR